ncbi:DUF3397 domain-containing protein [Bacillus sp. CGMCC 1.16607]|uniref:DUF3397 domain-containing protein n=1 Tax=Bacillus sp. CGMCC 1.16607 TaxID=3351842 RepID=UPI003629C5C3
MSNVISSFIAFFITIPILMYIIIFIISKQFTKNHRKSVHLALDYSTIFFIMSVHFLVKTIWDHSYLSFIFIFMLSCAIIFAIMNWKIKGEIIFTRIFKGFWRFSFLIFFLAYIGLTIYGVIVRVGTHL